VAPGNAENVLAGVRQAAQNPEAEALEVEANRGSPDCLKPAMTTSTLIVIVIVGQLVAMLLFRWIIWWYFGIDRAIAALESIDASLKCLPAVKSDASRRAA
jgi:hypothetical protein